jgi:plasmid maintenance system antidote protein VapI
MPSEIQSPPNMFSEEFVQPTNAKPTPVAPTINVDRENINLAESINNLKNLSPRVSGKPAADVNVG